MSQSLGRFTPLPSRHLLLVPNRRALQGDHPGGVCRRRRVRGCHLHPIAVAREHNLLQGIRQGRLQAAALGDGAADGGVDRFGSGEDGICGGEDGSCTVTGPLRTVQGAAAGAPDRQRSPHHADPEAAHQHEQPHAEGQLRAGNRRQSARWCRVRKFTHVPGCARREQLRTWTYNAFCAWTLTGGAASIASAQAEIRLLQAALWHTCMACTMGRHMQAGGNVQTESRSVRGHGVSCDVSCMSKLWSACAPRPHPSSWPRRRRLMSAAAIGCSSRPLQTRRLWTPCSRWQLISAYQGLLRLSSGICQAHAWRITKHAGPCPSPP